MKTSAHGRQKIMQREGLELHAYRDQRGIPTIGVGHTSAAGPPRVTIGMTISRDEADQILARDLVLFEDVVMHAVKRTMTQNEFDAMISLAFNIGVGGFRGSSVVKSFNAGNIAEAAKDFLLWDHPHSLLQRREDEKRQFLSP